MMAAPSNLFGKASSHSLRSRFIEIQVLCEEHLFADIAMEMALLTKRRCEIDTVDVFVPDENEPG